MMDRAVIERRLAGSAAAIHALRDRVDSIIEVAGAVRGCLAAGGTVYTAGNGGSAAHALHLAEELVGRYRADRGPLRAVSLCADPTALTCIGNDYGFDEVFARPCRSYLTERDALVVLSTSGKSRNLVRALEVARDRGATTVGLLGPDGAGCGELCGAKFLSPGKDGAEVQETHQVVIHLICELLEKKT